MHPVHVVKVEILPLSTGKQTSVEKTNPVTSFQRYLGHHRLDISILDPSQTDIYLVDLDEN